MGQSSRKAKAGYPFAQPCPVRDVLDRVGDQWSFLVLSALEKGTLRFNELLRDIGDISKQMLARTLRRLEEDGYVQRTLHAEIPPKVEYALTKLGKSAMGPLNLLVGWADTHHREVCEARDRYRSKKS